MESNVIDHEKAIQQMMAERYLLGELNPQEREAFEAHLFECSECFEQVRAGTEFVHYIKRIGAEESRAAESRPRWRQLLGLALRPAPVFALLFLCVASLSFYEGTLIHGFKQPKAVPAPMLKAARRSEDPNIVTAPRHSIFSLHLLFDARPEYVSYEGQIFPVAGNGASPAATGKGNPALQSFSISKADAQDAIAINLYSGDLQEGDYRLEVLGVKGDGSKLSVGSYYFKLVFQK